jgi:hypothetical protein
LTRHNPAARQLSACSVRHTLSGRDVTHAEARDRIRLAVVDVLVRRLGGLCPIGIAVIL